MRGDANRNCPATAIATIATATTQALARAHLAAENDDGRHQQQRVCTEIVDRQADRGEREEKRRKLAPSGEGGRCDFACCCHSAANALAENVLA